MVRWAQPADRPAVLDVLTVAGAGATCYSFDDFDGLCLIEEHEGVVRGVALISLARPYTVIREMAIRPESRKGWVLANLSAAIFAAAKAHGSQGVEGFKSSTDPEWIAFSRDRGAVVDGGVRIRWLLTSPAVVELLGRREDRSAT